MQKIILADVNSFKIGKSFGTLLLYLIKMDAYLLMHIKVDPRHPHFLKVAPTLKIGSELTIFFKSIVVNSTFQN